MVGLARRAIRSTAAGLILVAETEIAVSTEPCRHCDFAFQKAPGLTAALRYSAVRYQQVGYTVTDPVRLLEQRWYEPWTGLDCLVGVRDNLHHYTNHLARFAADLPVFGFVDRGLAQPYAQDYAAAMIGLTANLERLAEVIDTFPTRLWARRGVSRGRSVRAIDIGNFAVHEAAHHLVDLELLFAPDKEARPTADR